MIPIIEDARHPLKYRMLVPMCDCVFADVAQPDQARIVGLNASYYLKTGGHFVISIKVGRLGRKKRKKRMTQRGRGQREDGPRGAGQGAGVAARDRAVACARPASRATPVGCGSSVRAKRGALVLFSRATLDTSALTRGRLVIVPPSPVSQASCIDSTATPEAVFAKEVGKLQNDNLKPKEQLTLEPYERDHAVVVGEYRPTAAGGAASATKEKKKKKKTDE